MPKENDEATVICTMTMRVEAVVKIVGEFATQDEVLSWLADKNQTVVADAFLRRTPFGESIGWLDDNRSVYMGDVLDTDLISIETITTDPEQKLRSPYDTEVQ